MAKVTNNQGRRMPTKISTKRLNVTPRIKNVGGKRLK